MKPDSSLSIEMLTSCCLRSSNLVDGGELLLQLFLLVLREVAQRHAQRWQGILRKEENYWTLFDIIENYRFSLNIFEHYWNYQTKLLNSSGGESFEERKSLIIATPRVWTDGQLDVRAYSHQFPDQGQHIPACLSYLNVYLFTKEGKLNVKSRQRKECHDSLTVVCLSKRDSLLAFE